MRLTLRAFSASIVESLATSLPEIDDETAYAFAYCDFRNDASSQSASAVLGSLLAQLCTRLGAIPAKVLEAYDRRNQSSRPPLECLIQSLLEISHQRKLHLCVDALDETREAPELMDAFVRLLDGSYYIKILITGRSNVRVSPRLAKRAVHIDLSNRVAHVDHDIELYINKHLEEDSRLEWLAPNVRSHISKALISKSLGM